MSDIPPHLPPQFAAGSKTRLSAPFVGWYLYVLLLLPASLSAQQASIASRFTEARTTENNYAQAEAQCSRILTRLWARQGGLEIPAIRLEPIAAFGKPAAYEVERRTIVIDPRAYQLCLDVVQGEEDALAFLIAHELVHAFQQRDLGYDSPGFFVQSTTLEEWAENRKRRWRDMETKADIWGAVLCYLSGYRVEEIIPAFIEDLYDTFELKDEDPLYDSRTERLAIAQRAQQDLKQALMLFEMANYLTVLQQYDKSIALYEYLISDFRSAEFYNNLGLSYIMMALPRLPAPYNTLPYPFTLDTETRLEQVIKKSQLSPAEMIRSGIEQFDAIDALTGEYLPMRINRAAAYHLLSGADPTEKSRYLQLAQADIDHVMQTAASVYCGSEAELTRLKEKAQLMAAMIALPNIRPAGSSPRGLKPAPRSERYSINEPGYDWRVDLSLGSRISVVGKTFNSSLLTLYENAEKEEGCYLQRITRYMQAVDQKYKGQVYQVGAILPQPIPEKLRKSLPTLQGDYFLIDDHLGIVYKVNAAHRVQEWATYRTVE